MNSISRQPDPFNPDLQLPRVIAHRGASLHAPENTIAAIQKAHAMGATWIEFDVMLSRDREALIFHDSTLDRTTNGHGLVARTMSSVIATLDAGSWFSPEFHGERVPTFTECLECAADLGLGVNIEMKVGRATAPLLADLVIAGLARYWHKALPRPLVSSATQGCLAAMRARAPGILLGYISDRWRNNMFVILKRYPCVSLHVNHRLVTKERVKAVHAQGCRMLAYTVNGDASAQRLFDLGVDGIFSDNVGLCNEFT